MEIGNNNQEKKERRRNTDEGTEEIIARLGRLEENYYKMSLTVVKLETIVENFSNLVERFDTTLDKMNGTLNGLNITIVKINGKVDDNTVEIGELKDGLASVKKSVKDVDDKGKIDFLQVIKDNTAKFVFGGG